MPTAPSRVLLCRAFLSRAFLSRAFLGATLLAASAALAGGAAAADLMAALPGTWSGTGTVVKTDDTTESLRCKAKYSLAPSGTIMHQDLVCAADSYRMNFVTDIVNQGGRLAGTWAEKDRQASGPVTGTMEGDTIRTRITGTGFDATVVITLKGAKQTIALTSDSGNYAKSVTIALKAE